MRATHAEHVFVEAPVPRSWVTAPPRAPLHYLCTRSAACRAGPSPSGSKCLLARQMRRPCAAALPAHHCPARASLPCLCARSAACRECPRRGDRNACSRARCGFAQPIPTHTCKPARAAFSTPGFPAIARPNSRFPGSPASDSRFPGRNGRHRAGIRRETWNPHRKRLSPRTQKGSTTCED